MARVLVFFSVATALLLPTVLHAQAGVTSKPPVNAELRPVEPSSPAQAAYPTYELTAKWNSRTQVQTVPLANDTDQLLQILGVQTSGGLFVVAFPDKLPAKKSDVIAFVHQPAENSDGDLEVIRVLTDQGIRQIHVKVAREEVARLDVRELRWIAGDVATAKSATLALTAGTVQPVRVRATGGSKAELERVDATTWRIKVTPAATAKSGQFAVFVDFDQALPGKAIVILGVIQPKE